MAFNFELGLKQVLEKLNLSDAGVFGDTLSARNKTHSLDAITEAGRDACVWVARAICQNPASEYREPFVEAVPMSHNDMLPEHTGKPAYVQIQAYAGAPFREALHRDKERIESYRANNQNIYDSINHDQQGSTLAGFYDIFGGRFYFTGYKARLGLATVSRSTAQYALPDAVQEAVQGLWVENCVKAGEGAISLQIAQGYGAKAREILADMGITVKSPETDAPKPTSEVHQ